VNIRVTVKQLGKKQALLTEKIITIDYDQPIISLEHLIVAIVNEQVAAYNNKPIDKDDTDSTHLPLKNYIDILTETGKAGFGNIYHEAKADSIKARENALVCFQDGVFVMFQGDDQLIDLAQEIDLNLDLPFTFIRLTFLAGSIW
jgi:hypothetical protein